jgi:hypothetical protein
LSLAARKLVYETLVQAKFPLPHQTAYFVLGVEVRLRIVGDRGVSFEPGLRGSIDRYDCRHPDRSDFHLA